MELIRRTTRQIEPTDLGLRLYEHGATIRRALESAREQAAGTEDRPSGRVRISVPNAYGESLAGTHLLDLKAAYPGIVLDVIFENRITDLIRNEVDIAIRPLSGPQPNLDMWDLGPLRITACASPDYVESRRPIQRPEDLERVPIITATVLDRKLKVSARRDSMRKDVFVEPTLTSHNFSFLRTGVIRGMGVGLISDFIVETDIGEGTLVSFLDDWHLSMFGRRMYMLATPSKHRPPAITLTLEFLAEALGAVPTEPR